MKMLLEPADMIFVGVSQEERIDVKPALVIAIEPLSELLCDVRRVVVRIVGCGADVDVD